MVPAILLKKLIETSPNIFSETQKQEYEQLVQLNAQFWNNFWFFSVMLLILFVYSNGK